MSLRVRVHVAPPTASKLPLNGALAERVEPSEQVTTQVISEGKTPSLTCNCGGWGISKISVRLPGSGSSAPMEKLIPNPLHTAPFHPSANMSTRVRAHVSPPATWRGPSPELVEVNGAPPDWVEGSPEQPMFQDISEGKSPAVTVTAFHSTF
jgi:hypothetical protein